MKPDLLFLYAVHVSLLVELGRAGAGDECPSPLWLQFRDGCYAFLPVLLKNSLGIDRARELCKLSGAEILSINNDAENKFIAETFEDEWAGAEEIFLGIFFDTDANAFQWYDNSEVAFTNWAEGGVSGELLDTCAALHRQTGKWRRMSCEDFAEMGTLCKARLHSQGKKADAHAQEALVTSMVIVGSMLISIAALILAVQCKRNALPFGPTSRGRRPANPARFVDQAVLVAAEERVFCT